MQRYLTPQTELEVCGQLVNRNVRDEIRSQHEWLRNTRNVQPNVIELSEDAYLVLYLQVREMNDLMGVPVPPDIQDHDGMRIRRVDGRGVIRVMSETYQ